VGFEATIDRQEGLLTGQG